MLVTLEHKLEDLVRWAQVGRTSHLCVEAERQIACIDQKYTDWSNAWALLPPLQDLMVDDLRYRIEVLLAHAPVLKAEISHREAHARCYAICNSAASADPDRQERKEALTVLEDARLENAPGALRRDNLCEHEVIDGHRR
ncbi:hypothetical protein Poli38472_000421 [Pythium oligandrum]|uniref:Uncharacterized protein n=1 Tax=Pythium oligandrum TaxID=41045 RepID=A0A8K1CC96_PYTOL|nr:hypothetical protein Poli38472_000421 [Pythium oligandrum]|eukprot:TMW60379.1 hypothetical protein Poli38472_000421 [Pythium oligandrum]